MSKMDWHVIILAMIALLLVGLLIAQVFVAASWVVIQ